MSQPQWGYEPPPPWPASPPQRRRGNPLALLLLALVGLALVGLAALVAVSLTAKPAEIAYANEDYQVPPADLNPPAIPAPETLDQAGEWVRTNKIYDQTAPVPIRCPIQPIYVATADDALLDSHFESLMECLVRAWPLAQAGYQVYRPTVTIYDEEITTKCGSGNMAHNAFYCSANQQVYWSSSFGGDLAPPEVDKWAGDEVMAHEFGHAVQGRSGILASKNWLRSEAPSNSASLQIARRNETQADCLAGIFVRSVSRSLGLQQTDVAAIEDGFASGGDDVVTGKKGIEGNHGLAGTRRYWGATGLTTSAIGKCNTYAAPDNLVR